ncbi:MAG: ribulose-phosphate 3-epimerase [Clostridiales bacterium]|jgi:ribulose-phosphate 3-epimerase|nr:ribulose-phosphate 3-epimerase [Clostridiales bacterium]HOB64425.1 ribulose-phosphate 3-epimerase [Clostridia bacterium]HOK81174.1 ribulose-phosphate 3-epimerase [Clostridia bacterium]HOL60293.1 ribulose-phosphate 3-epimerase [Clostridia bacterium]HPO53826.1 ribulose-phosphate 3-epimerase [Clostridia bacterium]
MSKILIAPSILSGDFANMEATVKKVEEWGGDLVHCDVMDGVFVKNITFGMPMIAALKKVSGLPLDVHLMITEPERYIDEFIAAGSDWLSFHPNASKDPLSAIRKIREAGVKAGLVFNPDIPFQPYAHMFKECDFILVMSVFAGRGGQKFIESSLQKISEIKAYLRENNLDIPIEIDGGINEQTAICAREAGVDILVAGSAVFGSQDPAKTIKALRGE